MNCEVREVRGYNAFCIHCYTTDTTGGTYEEIMKNAHLPKGTRAFRITVGAGSRQQSSFLCLPHAREFRDMVVNLLGE